MFRSLLRRLVIGLILQSAAATSLQAQTTDDLFNDSAVQTLEIAIHSRDWDTLRISPATTSIRPTSRGTACASVMSASGHADSAAEVA